MPKGQENLREFDPRTLLSKLNLHKAVRKKLFTPSVLQEYHLRIFSLPKK